MIQKILIQLDLGFLQEVDDLFFKIKNPYKHWKNNSSLILEYINNTDLFFIENILKLDSKEKIICFISDFDFEYISRILKESDSFSFYSLWSKSGQYWKLYKSYSLLSEKQCFDQMLIDYNFLEKRNILESFKYD